MLSGIQNIFVHIINAIYPPRCIACDALLADAHVYICPDCNSRINWLSSDFFDADMKKRHFDSARSLATYEGAWAEVVHNFKYNNRTDLAKPLGSLLAKVIDYEYDIITIVPLHPSRLRERGYNQSALLAKEVSKRSGIKCELGMLSKTKLTAQQVGLSKQERMENVKGAFIIKPGTRTSSEEVHVPDILLIDDVMTTGATVNECAKVLKKSGAARVDVLTLARA